MRQNKNWWIGFVILVVILIGVFLDYKTKSIISGQVIKIGGAFALTGEAAAWGEMEKNATLLAIDEINYSGGINNKKIELIIEDTQSTGNATVNAVSKLINIDKVTAILGPTWLDVYSGAVPLAEKNNIIFMSAGSGASAINKPKINKDIFSTWYRTDYSYPALVNYIKKTGIKRLAYIGQNDPFYKDAAENVIKAAREDGINLVAQEFVNSGVIDLKTITLKVKAANPEAIIYGLYDRQAIQSFVKTAKSIMPNVKLFSDVIIQDFVGTDGFMGLFENNVIITPVVAKKEFRDKFYERYGKEPAFSAANAYDAVYILVQALNKRDKKLNIDLNNYFRANNFATVSFGEMSFDEIGGVKTENKFDIKKVINDQIVYVEQVTF